MKRHPIVSAYIRTFDQSSSRALHVDTDAGEFVIKVLNNPEGPRVLVNEWLGTSLARLLDLPVPDFDIVEVPARLQLPLRPGETAYAGLAFGSRFERGQTWGGEVDLRRAANLDAVSKLVVLDTWLRNVDRYSVGPDGRVRENRWNVFLSIEDAPRGRFILKAIDQGHSFGGVTWRSRDLRALPAVRDRRPYGNFPEFGRWLDREVVRSTVALATDISMERLENILGEMPRTWLGSGEDREALAQFVRDRAQFLATNIELMLWAQGRIEFDAN